MPSPASLLTFVFSALAAAAPTPSKRATSTARSSPPSGCLAVRASGASGSEYSSVADAIASLSGSDACIFLYAGTYEEQLTIDYAGALTLYGETTDTSSYESNTVTITNTATRDGAGTLDLSSTVNIVSDDFSAYNIVFENGYGKGTPAVAVTANADKLGFYGCSFIGYQDTLYAKDGDQYYSNCYVEGATDFIFGAASAWFSESTIAASGPGYITAMSREEEDDPAWYVFDDCTITAADGASVTEQVYLGRPWRDLARVMYQNSVLTDVVNPAGYTTMSTAPDATPTFEEYNNTGDGADTSERKADYFTAATAAVTKAELWPVNGESWVDSSY